MIISMNYLISPAIVKWWSQKVPIFLLYCCFHLKFEQSEPELLIWHCCLLSSCWTQFMTLCPYNLVILPGILAQQSRSRRNEIFFRLKYFPTDNVAAVAASLVATHHTNDSSGKVYIDTSPDQTFWTHSWTQIPDLKHFNPSSVGGAIGWPP